MFLLQFLVPGVWHSNAFGWTQVWIESRGVHLWCASTLLRCGQHIFGYVSHLWKQQLEHYNIDVVWIFDCVILHPSLERFSIPINTGFFFFYSFMRRKQRYVIHLLHCLKSLSWSFMFTFNLSFHLSLWWKPAICPFLFWIWRFSCVIFYLWNLGLYLSTLKYRASST